MAPPRPEFDPRVERISGPWGKKNPLTVLATRLGALGHGPGFGGFSAAGRSRSRFLLMKNGGVRSPPMLNLQLTVTFISYGQFHSRTRPSLSSSLSSFSSFFSLFPSPPGSSRPGMVRRREAAAAARWRGAAGRRGGGGTGGARRGRRAALAGQRGRRAAGEALLRCGSGR